MKPSWIGLDAGGTGSTLVVTDIEMNTLVKLNGPAIQARKMPLKHQIAVITDYMEQVDREVGLSSIGGVGLGIAGAGRPDERIAIETAFALQYPRLPCTVVPDSEAAHVGAFANGNGILVITGTGSIVWGRSGASWHRAGGFGYLIGDEGSGMKLGMEGLSAAGLAWDGGQPTALCELLMEHHAITDGASMVKAVYDAGFQPSQVAIHVLEAASKGDQTCQLICERQSRLLAEQVNIVAIKVSDIDRRVILWGGLQKNTYYRTLIHRAIADIVGAVQFADPIYEPWIGAALIAKNRSYHIGSSGTL